MYYQRVFIRQICQQIILKSDPFHYPQHRSNKLKGLQLRQISDENLFKINIPSQTKTSLLLLVLFLSIAINLLFVLMFITSEGRTLSQQQTDLNAIEPNDSNKIAPSNASPQTNPPSTRNPPQATAPPPQTAPPTPPTPPTPPARKPTSRDLNKNLTNSQAFTVIYDEHIWDRTGKNPSGEGSIPQRNYQYLILVQYLIDSPEINKIVEIGFGDYNLAKNYRLREGKTWVGYDVVSSLLRPNETNRTFKLKDNIFNFHEEGDLLIEKDVIQHWPNEAAEYFYEQIIPRYKYALITNDHYQRKTPRPNIKYGQYQPMNVDEKRPNILVMTKSYSASVKKSYLYPGWPK